MGPSTLSPSVRACPVEGGELPDCAGIIAALEATTQKKVEVIVGKPSPITMQVALEVMGLGAAECILIGDRLETDIRMGLEAGMKTALVMTGVTDAKTLEASPSAPTMFSRALPIWKICCSTLLKIVHPLRFSDRMSGGQRPPARQNRI